MSAGIRGPMAAAALVVLALAAAGSAPRVADADGGPRADGIAAGFGAIWTTSRNGLVRIAPGTRRITAEVPARIESMPTLTTGEGSIWMLTLHAVTRIDPQRNRADRPVRLQHSTVAFAVGAGALWVADYDDPVLRKLDPRTGRELASISGIGLHAEAMVATKSAIWVASIGPWRQNSHGEIKPVGPGSVARVDPRNNRVVARIPVGRGPGAIATGHGAVWVANSRGLRPEFSVTRIDTASNRVTATIRLRRALPFPAPAVPVAPLAAVAIGGAYAWILSPGRFLRGGIDTSGGTLFRIDSRSNHVVADRLRGSSLPDAIVPAHGSLWIGSPGNGYVLQVMPKTMRTTRTLIPFG